MVEVDGTLYIRCNNCGALHKVDVSDIIIQDETYSERAPMDIRVNYRFFGNYQCQCQAVLALEILATEYPSGALESSSVNLYDAEYYGAPNVNIECYPDDYEFSNHNYGAVSHKAVIQNMNDREFELFVGSVFLELGYKVTVTKRTRDGAFDFEAIECRNGITTTIIGECKHFSEHRKVGEEIIRKTHDAQYERHANKAMVITSSHFTRDAMIKASQYGMDLWDIDDLLRYGKNLLPR